MELQDLRTLAVEAAQEAGAMLRTHFGGKQAYRHKTSPVDLVTEFDHRSEELIIAKIQRYCPDHTILSEEGRSHAQDSAYRWIIDPLDGTTNFAHGLPIFAVAIGLEFRGQLQVGVVHLPVLNELFVAARDQGATLNGQEIGVSTTDCLAQALVIASSPHDQHLLDLNLKLLDGFVRESQSVLRIGSAAAAIAYVAAGRADGYWGMLLHPWDLAAPSLILEEAGGRLSDFDDQTFSLDRRDAIASNGKIHSEMIKIFREEFKAKGAQWRTSTSKS
jgi:myo-inositol-1(or 4)-monophosphatase